MNRRESQSGQVEASQPTAFPRGTLGSLQPKDIERLCAEIASEFHPEKIVLFGSHAYGKPGPESDVDLLVVMPFDGSPFRQAAVILNHVVHAVGATLRFASAHCPTGTRANSDG